MTNFAMPQPRICSRCGQLVLPDPAAPNTWLDQQGGRLCVNLQTPHIGGALAPAPSYAAENGHQKNRKRAWFLGLVAVVSSLALVMTLISLLSKDDNSTDQAGQSAIQGAPASEQTIPTQANGSHGFTILPFGPAPCDPELPGARWCFAPEVKGTDMIQRIRQDSKGWKCYRHKDPEAPKYSGVDRNTELCRVVDRQEPYSRDADISHVNSTYNPDLPMESVQVTFSASYIHGEEQQISGVEANKAGDIVAEKMIGVLWAANPDIQQQARDTLKKVKEDCDKSQVTFGGPHGWMPLGYKISCSPANTAISIKDSKGRTHTTYTGSIKISAPSGSEEIAESQKIIKGAK